MSIVNNDLEHSFTSQNRFQTKHLSVGTNLIGCEICGEIFRPHTEFLNASIPIKITEFRNE